MSTVSRIVTVTSIPERSNNASELALIEIRYEELLCARVGFKTKTNRFALCADPLLAEAEGCVEPNHGAETPAN
jgi:hypothetical protein